MSKRNGAGCSNDDPDPNLLKSFIYIYILDQFKAIHLLHEEKKGETYRLRRRYTFLKPLAPLCRFQYAFEISVWEL